MCALCHGPRGEGGTGPRLDRWDRDRAALVRAIDERMPVGDPGACVGACAERIADEILAFVAPPAPTCAEPILPERRVRLLSRREYAHAVRALVACDRHLFRFTPAGAAPTAVVVAGSFNGWAATAADGGWPMRRDGAEWTLDATLPNGRHEYKLVLDGRDWRADPSNPRSAPDGHGGRNSVLEIACDDRDLAADLPPEARPEGFAFDHHAGAIVSPVLADAYLDAARRVAAGVDRARLPSIEVLGRRAFRRPLTGDELARYRALGDRALEALLISPHFLYRFELGVPGADGVAVLGPYERASALAFTLWGAPPDDVLLDAAERGELDSPDGMESAARRLLDDPRARAAFGRFARDWLGVAALESLVKHPSMELEAATRTALLDELERFVVDAVFGGGGLDAILSAPHRAPSGLASYYAGSSEHRAGVLGLGAVLASYAYSDQSAPVRRGVFVRSRLLCQDLPAPPPNAGGIPEVDPAATTRERFAQHSSDPFCRGCHRFIDGVGFGFERFDAVGRYRTAENGRPIDAAGNMNDTERLGDGVDAPFASLAELGAILARSPRAKACFATHLVRWADGDQDVDLCAVSRLPPAADVRDILIALVRSEHFVRRRP